MSGRKVSLAFTYGISAWWFTHGAALGGIVKLGQLYVSAIVAGTATLILAKTFGLPSDLLWWGLAACPTCCGLG